MHSYRTTLPRRLSRNLKTTSIKPTNTNQTRTMAFFPRNFYNAAGANDASFTPLFRLLDDFDTYSRQSSGTNGHGRRQQVPSWQPKFDIRETGEAYELHGELPGLSKENVNIEFTEPQTMLVRGKVERTYTAGTPPSGQIEGASPNAAIADKEAESRKSHQPTVEDEDEDTEIVSAEEQQDSEQEAQKAPVKAADKAKYWLTERSIGEFARTFNFPARVDQESVNASLKDGILTVTVPKAKKHEARRIAIN